MQGKRKNLSIPGRMLDLFVSMTVIESGKSFRSLVAKAQAATEAWRARHNSIPLTPKGLPKLSLTQIYGRRGHDLPGCQRRRTGVAPLSLFTS
jgi:hypothetical protein